MEGAIYITAAEMAEMLGISKPYAEINVKAEKLVKDKISNLERQYDNKKFALEHQYKNDNLKMMHQHKKRTIELNTKYQAMVDGYRGMVYFILFYSVITTLITACLSDAFVNDFRAFFRAIWDGANVLVGWVKIAADFVARLGDMLRQPIDETMPEEAFSYLQNL